MRNFDGIQNHIQNSTFTPEIPARPKRKKLKWILLFLLLLAAGGFVFGSTILSKANQIFTNKENIFVRVGKLLVSDDKPLTGEEEGSINILLLGMGGPGHEGPLLTDTMIVANFNVATSEVNLVSIPRDFMVRLNGRGYNKINAAYAFAEMSQQGSGGEAAIKAAEEITGLKIPYFAAIDFKGFVKAVDHVGGLDITVDRTFTDSSYPDYNNGYLPPQTFTKGPQHMNGERALIFARSRKGNNGEGSDFSRSERQKKIMLALKEELLKLNISNVSTINNLLSDFTQNVRTNFEPYELKRLSELGSKITQDKVFSLSLEPQENLICDALVDLATGKPAPAVAPTPETDAETTDALETEAQVPAPQINRAYVVTPCSGKTISDVHEYLRVSMANVSLTREEPTIEIQNSSGKSVAFTNWNTLLKDTLPGLTVKTSAFKGATPYERTILYDNTKGSKPKTLEYLKSRYTFSVADLPYSESTADFVVILGKDAI